MYKQNELHYPKHMIFAVKVERIKVVAFLISFRTSVISDFLGDFFTSTPFRQASTNSRRSKSRERFLLILFANTVVSKYCCKPRNRILFVVELFQCHKNIICQLIKKNEKTPSFILKKCILSSFF